MRTRTQPPDQSCCRPSVNAPYAHDGYLSPQELARRLAIETAHEADTVVASEEIVRQHLDAQRAAREGLCPCCGEFIGPVYKCPICNSVLWKVSHKKGGRKKKCKSANTK